MNPTTLNALMKARRLSASELARRTGLDTGALIGWLQQSADVDVDSDALQHVADALGIERDRLERPLPCMAPGEHERLRATLLWDGLFADLDDLAIALNRADPRAIARLVQVHGLFAAEKTIGPSVWDEFPSYARYIHPVRRRQLEQLRQWRAQNPT